MARAYVARNIIQIIVVEDLTLGGGRRVRKKHVPRTEAFMEKPGIKYQEQVLVERAAELNGT